jgi:hypothetical protein
MVKKRTVNVDYLTKLKEGVRKYQENYKKIGIKRNCSEEKKEKLRKSAKILCGKDNPRYGNFNNYEIWLKKYGKYEADKRLIEFKKKISKATKGKNNPMYGKPSPQGSGNGWSGWYNGWYFRSLLELSYMINEIENNNKRWETGEQNKYKIEYVDYEGKNRNYFPDFVIDNKFLIECKPLRLHNTSLVKSKTEAAEKFCKKNGLVYILTCPKKLNSDEVKKLHNLGKIKFLDRYEEKYQQLYGNN